MTRIETFHVTPLARSISQSQEKVNLGKANRPLYTDMIHLVSEVRVVACATSVAFLFFFFTSTQKFKAPWISVRAFGEFPLKIVDVCHFRCPLGQ